MLERRTLEFGSKFRGRLDDLWLETSLDYINYGEWGLALDFLCGYLWDYDVAISEKEFDEAISLALDMGFNPNETPFKQLKNLIKDN